VPKDDLSVVLYAPLHFDAVWSKDHQDCVSEEDENQSSLVQPFLDANDTSLTLTTLAGAAAALDQRIKLELRQSDDYHDVKRSIAKSRDKPTVLDHRCWRMDLNPGHFSTTRPHFFDGFRRPKNLSKSNT